MLIDYLRQFVTELPMHMPGHKRNLRFFPFLKDVGGALDITEIKGMDNLHAPTGIIKETMDLATNLWGAKTLIGVNGSTGCLHAVILALTKAGDTVLVARNAHVSVYNALRLVKARVIVLDVAVDPDSGIIASVQSEQICNVLLKYPEVKLVIITSPTYEGVISDIQAIADTVHNFGAKLLVDEAHGSHLGICSNRQKNAIQSGADVVVHSLHKTLPSLTQTALLHVNDPSLFDDVAEKMDMLQTTSPSYLFLASIDACVRLLLTEGERLFAFWQQELGCFYHSASNLLNLKVPYVNSSSNFYALDLSKIVIGGRRKEKIGSFLTQKLRHHGIEPEMMAVFYTLCLSSIGDERKGYDQLFYALQLIDKELPVKNNLLKNSFQKLPSMGIIEPFEEGMNKISVLLEAARGKPAAETVYVYPPGVPVLIPGVRVSREAIDYIKQAQEQGLQVIFSNGTPQGKIRIFEKK